MNYNLSIPLVPPSANMLLRLHWAKRTVFFTEWQKAVFICCRQALIPMLDFIHVEATIYYGTNRRRDQDNSEYGLKKLLGDALKGIVIPDDSPEYLEWGEIKLDYDKNNPRTEVQIWGR